ncbi:MAG: surface lipoprotein assembly modifier [Pseudomonas sp.]
MKRILCPLLLSFCIHSPLTAASDADVETLTRLNASGDAASAFQLATSMLPTWEGDPAFDRQYALAALESGHASEAIFALERLLMLDPQDNSARSDIARAYALLSREPLLLGIDPLAAAREATPLQQTFSGSLRVGGGYGENVDAGPDSNVMMTPSGEVTVAGLRQRNDTFGSLELNGLYRFPLGSTWRGFVEGRMASRFYNEADDLDSLSMLLRTGALLEQDRTRWELSLHGQQYRLDDSRFLTTYGLATDYLYGLSDGLAVGFFASVNRQDYAISDLDSNLLLAGLKVNWKLVHQLDPLIYAGFYRGWEEPLKQNAVSAGRTERDLLAGYAGVRLELSEKLWANLEGALVNSRYDGPFQLIVPATGNARRDDFLELKLDLGWRMDERWSGQLRYSFHDNASNTDVLEYRRQQIELMLQYGF